VKPFFHQLTLAVLVIGVSACNNGQRWFAGNQRSPQQAKDAISAQPLTQEELAFHNGTLNQADPQGRPLWQIKVKQATYNQDRRTAQVQELVGELFQDGKSVFQIKAKQGEVYPESQKISLKGEIIATDIRNGIRLEGRELEWQPQADLLTLRRNLSIIHPQVRVSAREAYASSRTHQLQAQGQVVAVLNQPKLRLRTERLVWQLVQQRLTAGSTGNARPVQIEHLVRSQPTDRATAGQAILQLNPKVLALQSNVRLSFLNPELDMTSQQLVWNLGQGVVTSPQALYVQDRGQKVAVTANAGQLDLNQNRVQLTGSVQTTGKRNRSLLKTDQLTWRIPTQSIEARGNVVYQQQQPRFELRGPQAFGKFQEQAVLISGGNVVTEIIP